MSGRVGSITTDIIADGLVFNMDAANRASYIPDATTSFNTINLNESGSFVSDPTYISPPTSASCWSFDGIDDGINIGSIGPDTGLTFNVWFKIGGAAGTRAYGAIINNWTSAASGQYCWIGTDLNNPAEIQAYFDGANKFSFPDQPFQTWRLLTFTHDSDNNIIGYINGIQTNTATGAARTISGVTVLGYDVNRNNYPFLGEIASLQIYNRALSANEVLHNYNALKGRFE
jgi:hypothetical protein|tara:strand:+ start:496 stop:1185 length:690 start_codon:yes stop_codon:yes gene_type:complete